LICNSELRITNSELLLRRLIDRESVTKAALQVLWLKGIEMDAPTSKALVHYLGAAIIICAIAVLIHVIRWW
jgi:hypothetical protein